MILFYAPVKLDLWSSNNKADIGCSDLLSYDTGGSVEVAYTYRIGPFPPHI